MTRDAQSVKDLDRDKAEYGTECPVCGEQSVDAGWLDDEYPNESVAAKLCVHDPDGAATGSVYVHPLEGFDG